MFHLPRPMLHSKDLNFSFSGLKTAVLTTLKKQGDLPSEQVKADIARAFVDAIVEVLAAKCALALRQTGLKQLVVAGGVGANRQLRAALNGMAVKRRCQVFYPELEFCTDNGAMICFCRCHASDAESGCRTERLRFHCPAKMATGRTDRLTVPCLTADGLRILPKGVRHVAQSSVLHKWAESRWTRGSCPC